MGCAYVHVTLSVVVEAEQHQALLSAVADAPETLQNALPRFRIYTDFSTIFFSDLYHTIVLSRCRERYSLE
jgi:hypothetical protein